MAFKLGLSRFAWHILSYLIRIVCCNLHNRQSENKGSERLGNCPEVTRRVRSTDQNPGLARSKAHVLGSSARHMGTVPGSALKAIVFLTPVFLIPSHPSSIHKK